MPKRRIVSLETRKKISESEKGKIVSAETRKKISEKSKGRKASFETRQKMSLAHKGVIISPEHKERLRILHLGDKNPQWKGGVTPIYQVIRHSIEYKLWRKAVWERDNWTCIWCGRKNGTWIKEEKRAVKVHADHIKPFAQYPELRFALDNGRTLCSDCHRKTETYGLRPQK